MAILKLISPYTRKCDLSEKRNLVLHYQQYFNLKKTLPEDIYYETFSKTNIIHRSSRSHMFFKIGVLRCFSVNITKFLRTVFFIEHLRWLLLYTTPSLIIQPTSLKIYFAKIHLFAVVP